MEKFKYKIVSIYDSYDSEIERRLNEYGSQGWQLVVRREYQYIFIKKDVEPIKTGVI